MQSNSLVPSHPLQSGSLCSHCTSAQCWCPAVLTGSLSLLSPIRIQSMLVNRSTIKAHGFLQVLCMMRNFTVFLQSYLEAVSSQGLFCDAVDQSPVICACNVSALPLSCSYSVLGFMGLAVYPRLAPNSHPSVFTYMLRLHACA